MMRTRLMTLLIMGRLTKPTWSAAKVQSCQQRNQHKRRRTRSIPTTLFRNRVRAQCFSNWISLAAVTSWKWTRPRAVPHHTSQTIRWVIWIRKMRGSRSRVCLIRIVISTTRSSPKKCSRSWAVFKRRRPMIFRSQTLLMLIGLILIRGSNKLCNSVQIVIQSHHRYCQRAL